MTMGLVAVLVVAISFSIGCRKETTNDPFTAQEKEWLSKHDGKIVLGHDPNAKPVDFIDEKGEFRGIAADYVKLLEERLHIKFKIVHLKTWEEVLTKAKEREIDVLCAFAKNADREEWMLFTDPYLVIPTVILTRKDDQRDLSLGNMKGMKITFTKDWVVDDYLRTNHGDLEFLPAVNGKAAMNYLSTGQADAWVTALTIASNEIEKNKVSNLRIAGEVDLSINLAFASRKDWPILNRILDKGLRLISPEEKKTILNRWIHIESEGILKSKKFWISLAGIAAILLLPTMIIFAWNKSLKREVERQTVALKHELSERKKVEENLRITVERLDLATRAGKMGIWDWDIQKNELIWDDGMHALYGIRPEDFVGAYEAWLAGVHPEDRDDSNRESEKARKGEKEYDTEFRIRWPDGTVRLIKGIGKVVRDADGKPVRMIGVNFDITGQRQTEEELRKINRSFAVSCG